MGRDSAFIRDLRTGWNATFGSGAPFAFWAVAGDQDEFVPRTSSIDPFPSEQRAVVPGNHLQIVKPLGADHLGFQLVRKALVGDAAPAGPWNAARVAVESRDFRRAVRLLEPHRADLDEPGLVQLALALEGVGRQQDAVTVLEEAGHPGTDAMGVLAGRLKRRWLAQHRKADAERAWALYLAAFESSRAKPDHSQAFYHGINLAFLELAYRRDSQAAGAKARAVLAHCEQAEPDQWRFATEGEAHLILGDTATAFERYRRALDCEPSPRETESMYRQAVWVAQLTGQRAALRELETLFRGAPP